MLKWASTLCGIIVGKYEQPTAALEEHEGADSICEKYKKGVHPLVGETREDRLNKRLKEEIEERNHEWGILENEKTINNFMVS